MARPFSNDLRDRVVGAVTQEGLSCRAAAKRFGIGISTAIDWVRRFHATGSAAPGQMGGHKPRAICGGHREWLVERCRASAFTLRGWSRNWRSGVWRWITGPSGPSSRMKG